MSSRGFVCCVCGADIPKAKDWFNPYHDGWRVFKNRKRLDFCSPPCLGQWLEAEKEAKSR